MPAMSPRQPAPRLRSTVVEEWGSPRREQSDLQRRALIQRFTFRAGPVTESRLHRGILHAEYPTAS